MSKSKQYEKELRAINQIIVLARYMAYKKELHEKIAQLLDIAEILPVLMYSKETFQDDFILYLQDIALKFPAGTHILDDYKGTENRDR